MQPPKNGNQLLSERNRMTLAAVIVYILTNDKNQMHHDLSVEKSEARENARNADLYSRLRDKNFPRN